MSGLASRFFDATRGSGRVVVVQLPDDRERTVEDAAAPRDGALLDRRKLRERAVRERRELGSGQAGALARFAKGPTGVADRSSGRHGTHPEGTPEPSRGLVEVVMKPARLSLAERRVPTRVHPGDPREAAAWIEAERDGWRAAARVVMRDGAAVIAELRLYPDDGTPRPGEWSHDPKAVPGNGLTTGVLRSTPTDRLLEAVRERVEHLAGLDGAGLDAAFADFEPLRSAPQRSRPRKRNDRQLAETVAAVAHYKDAGSPRAIDQAAADLGYTPGTIRNQLTRARDRGIAAGDQLTDRGRSLLGE